MFDAIADFVSPQQGDSADFIKKAQALTIGVAQDYEPTRIYLIRIDNWFGPRWMHFAGKISAGRHFYGGVHKKTLHVPPFVPHRVLAERVLEGPGYQSTVGVSPLHISCSSHDALLRRIADIDPEAVFVWFSGTSETQKRGAVMVYLPTVFTSAKRRSLGHGQSGAFYVGFSQREKSWEPSVLRGISRAEVAHLQESRELSLPAVT